MPGAFITFGADVAVVTSRSPDGTAFSFIPVPILPDPTEIPPTPKLRVGTLDSVEAAYIPGVPLTLPTVDSVLIPLLDTVPGHDAPATAPVIATPAIGGNSAFFDTGGTVLALFPWDQLAADATLPDQPRPKTFRGSTKSRRCPSCAR